MKKLSAIMLVIALLLVLTSCATVTNTSAKVQDSAKAQDSVAVVADLVVYGKIYTSNEQRDVVEAFAVKDGKYIYVGNAEGAEAYLQDGVTEIVDHRGEDRLILAGATEGHGHYILASTMVAKNLFMTASTIDEVVDYMREHVKTHPTQKLYFTYGWDNVQLASVKAKTDIRALLDSICSDKIIVMMDNTGHNAFLNSKAIEAAGMTADTEIEGGFISKDENGRLLGLVSDIATNYVIYNVIAKSDFMTEEDFASSMKLAEDLLHSYGYTNYFDAYTSFFGESAYRGISEYDKKEGMTLNVGGSFKIDPYNDYDDCLETAVRYKKEYSSKHFFPNSIKLFADGECVESLSGWVLSNTAYKDGTTGTQVWPDETMNYIVREANEKGIAVHVHASGDGAMQQAVNAFIAAEEVATEDVLNCVAHSRNVTEETLDKMAEHDIYSATNICWRMFFADSLEAIEEKFDKDFYMAGYPMKSLLARGINMTSSTDYPSNSGAPCDIANIIEIAVNGTVDAGGLEVLSVDKSECISVEDALEVMTINGAIQLGIQEERGSIEVGKYADFLILNKDILSCEPDQIHEGQVNKVYFEGLEVYSAN
jgi:predicted amidohydrolase YtcJ